MYHYIFNAGALLGVVSIGTLVIAWLAVRVFLMAKWSPNTLPVLPQDFGLRAPDAKDKTAPKQLAVRTLVIGAGVAGCTAAALLRQSGRKVTVVEACSDVGGRCRTRLVPCGKWLLQVRYCLQATNPPNQPRLSFLLTECAYTLRLRLEQTRTPNPLALCTTW